MRTPALPLCLAYVLGLLLPIAVTSPLVLFALAACCLGAALVCAAHHCLRVGLLFVIVAFVVLGSAAKVLWTGLVDSPLRGAYARIGERGLVYPRRIEGRLRREPEQRRDQTVLTVDTETLELGGEKIFVRGGLRASVRGERREQLATLATGDRVDFWARLRKPSYFRNPGGFDGPASDARRRIDLIASVKSGLLVKPVAKARTLTSSVSRLRRRALERLQESLPAESFGVVAALVTGERSAIRRETERIYQRAGTFHVMAISGAHVAIWILCLHAFLRSLGLQERTTLVVLLVLLPFYAVFCGSRAPVVRAVVMASVMIAARLLSIRSPARNGVALAALLLLVWEPHGIGDPGFQLTFAAMAAIVLYAEGLSGAFGRCGPFARPLAISVAAQLGVMPVTAWHFHRLSPLAPVASLAAMPVAAAVCILGLVLIVVSSLPLMSPPVSFLTHHAALLLTGIAELAAVLPGASVRVGAPSLLWLALYAGWTLALPTMVDRWRRGCAVVLATLLLTLVLPGGKRAPGALEIAALDVGHGDAILVSLPGGGRILVDGGGLPRASLDVGESVVLPFLLESGVRSLDAVVVSHADFDHIGGLATVIDELGVGAIWEGTPEWNRSAYRTLRDRASRRGIPFRALHAGEAFHEGGVRFEVLSAGGLARAKANDRSLVLRLTYGKRRVLLTGDAEAALEEELLTSGTDLRADVLKLAHHGSRSSTTDRFLEAVQPKIAIVSARRNDARPLPSALVLHRLRRRAVEYARTDRHGTVTVRIEADGDIVVSTYREVVARRVGSSR